MRAILYVDGFNLYHAIDELNDHRLKWLSLKDLGQTIIPKRSQALVKVIYFSAFAHYRSAKDPTIVARHERYVAALESTGVEIVLGNFKAKPRKCHTCKARWQAHEEKETDVNIAVRLVSRRVSR